MSIETFSPLPLNVFSTWITLLDPSDVPPGMSPSLADVDFFPGVTLKWGLGHMLNMQAIPHGRSAGSMTWAGIYNTYYWIDPTRKIAAVFLTQVLPFADHRAVRLYRQYERGIYAGL